MITGDNINTAIAIAKRIGLFAPNESTENKAFTGEQFKLKSEAEKLECVKHAKIFARVEPVDKRDLVLALHKHKRIVAMTGFVSSILMIGMVSMMLLLLRRQILVLPWVQELLWLKVLLRWC
jgi:hypothetical protein